MTESTPRLPSASGDTSNYAPYSFLSVFALLVAGLFAVLLLTMGISSWMISQPMFEPRLLILPIVAVILAYAGRKQIQNSEGTRVGLRFCNWAWWIAIIGGCAYAAYLVGIGFAVRSDADEAFARWGAVVVKVDPIDPKNVDLGGSFHATLPPEKQPSVSPNDSGKLRALYASQMMAFRQSDLIRLCFRNPNAVRFEVMGLEDWENDKTDLNCRLTVKLHCPEGEFQMSIALKKSIVEGKPQPVWQVLPPQNEATNYVRPLWFSTYGERIRDMEIAAHSLVYNQFLNAVSSKAQQASIFRAFGEEQPDPTRTYDKLVSDWQLRLALYGGLGAYSPEPGENSPEWLLKLALSGGLNATEARHRYFALAENHFKPLEPANALDERKMREAFIEFWRHGEFRRPNTVIPKNPDVNMILVPGEEAWYARVPIEMQPSATGLIACRGVVVLKLDNKEFLKLLNESKADAARHEVQYRPAPVVPVPWRVVRIESDLRAQAPQRNQPGDDGQ